MVVYLAAFEEVIMGRCGYERTFFVLRLKQIDALLQDSSQYCTNVEADCMRLRKEVPWMVGMTMIDGFTLFLPSVFLQTYR